jgi:hypothetical protein
MKVALAPQSFELTGDSRRNPKAEELAKCEREGLAKAAKMMGEKNLNNMERRELQLIAMGIRKDTDSLDGRSSKVVFLQFLKSIEQDKRDVRLKGPKEKGGDVPRYSHLRPHELLKPEAAGQSQREASTCQPNQVSGNGHISIRSDPQSWSAWLA